MSNESLNEKDEDWGDSFDDQDSEYWESYLGGPDDSEIERYYQEKHSQTFGDDFPVYETETTPFEDYVPPISDSEIEQLRYQENSNCYMETFFFGGQNEKEPSDPIINNSKSSSLEKQGHLKLSSKRTRVKKESKEHNSIIETARLGFIYFFTFAFFAVGFADLSGFSLKTSLVGTIIDWTVLTGVSIHGIISIVSLIGLACFLIFCLLKHAVSLFSKDPNRRQIAWKETKNSFRQLGNGIWSWVKIICFVVGAITILSWI